MDAAADLFGYDPLAKVLYRKLSVNSSNTSVRTQPLRPTVLGAATQRYRTITDAADDVLPAQHAARKLARRRPYAARCDVPLNPLRTPGGDETSPSVPMWVAIHLCSVQCICIYVDIGFGIARAVHGKRIAMLFCYLLTLRTSA
jgi:hypothetical protein